MLSDLLRFAWLVLSEQVDHQNHFCIVYDIILLNMIISLILLNDNAKKQKKEKNILANRSFVGSSIQFSVLLLLNLEYAVTTVEILEYKYTLKSLDGLTVRVFVRHHLCLCIDVSVL